MNKEEILKMSQQENKGKCDEMEISISHKASSISKSVGITVCILLTLIETIFFESTDISTVAYLIITYMTFAEFTYLYKHLRKRSYLVLSIIAGVVAICYTALFVYKIVIGEFT